VVRMSYSVHASSISTDCVGMKLHADAKVMCGDVHTDAPNVHTSAAVMWCVRRVCCVLCKTHRV